MEQQSGSNEIRVFLGELFNWEKNKQVEKGWNYGGKKDPETKFIVTEWCRRQGGAELLLSGSCGDTQELNCNSVVPCN